METSDSADLLSLITERGFEYWASRNSLSPFTRDALLNAKIVLVPHENFGEQVLPVFPDNTTELFRSLREQAPEGITVEIAVEDKDYREVALHSELVRLATILVQWIVAPVAVGLLVEYLKTSLGPRFSQSQVEMSLIVEQECRNGRRAFQLNYKGPAESFAQTVNSSLAKAATSEAVPPDRED